MRGLFTLLVLFAVFAAGAQYGKRRALARMRALRDLDIHAHAERIIDMTEEDPASDQFQRGGR